jgi:hypothetical protein
MSSNIKGAIEQSNQAKTQLKIINDTISALERKSRIETQATRSLIADRRDADLATNRSKFTDRREGIFEDLKAGRIKEGSVKGRLDALSGAETDTSDRIKATYRENLQSVKEQERQIKLQTALSKEQLDTIRQTARDQVKAVLSGDEKLGNVFTKATTDEQKLIAGLTKEGVGEYKNREKVREEKSGPGIFSSMVAAQNINNLISSAGQLASTKTGFDAISKIETETGSIVGGILGAIIGTIVEPGGGSLAGYALGSAAGKIMGEFKGKWDQDKGIAREQFTSSRFRYLGITGSEANYVNTENAGTGLNDFLKLQSEYARRRGYGFSSGETTRDALYAEKGFGISQIASAGLIELQRSASEGNKSLAMLIGGLLEKSQNNILKNGDRTFADELINKYTSVSKELLKTAERVPTGLPLDILSRFNAIGGAFSARDPRSLGNINSIQGSLSNPASDNIKALAFRVLSGQNPGAGLFDLREQMQGGLNSQGYLRGMLGFIDKTGGNDQFKMNNLSGMFPGLPLSAIRRLFNNRSGLMNGNLSVEDLKNNFPLDFQGASDSKTTPLERNSAILENVLLMSDNKRIESMASAVKAAFKETFSGAVIEMKNGKITLIPKIKENVASTPDDDKKAQYNAYLGMYGLPPQ